jgi:putative copper export protein/mono/diheme cytochrome c family protein
VIPAFDIDGGLGLALVRSVSVAALLSVFGTLVFQVFVAPRADVRMAPDTAVRIQRQLLRTSQISVATGIVAILAWLLMQAADMASAASLSAAFAAIPAVVTGTVFGHLIVLQFATLMALAVMLRRRGGRVRQRLGLGLATVAVGLQAGHSHAASMYGGLSVLLAFDALHLLGAGAWLGGLLPLLLVVKTAPPKAGATAARWFSPLGQVCIVALLVSSAVQGWVLVASIPGLVGTAYGWMAVVKLALFGVLFAFAWVNRYRFAPAMARDDPAAQAKSTLVRSVAVQTGFGLAIIAAAAVLSSLAPAMHEQALWPFPERFTLDTLSEDPDFRREVIGALAAIGVAVVLLVAAVLLRLPPILGRPVRWLLGAGAALMVWFAVPHLDLLFVPAYPTSYYHSPTGFTAVSIVQGEALYPSHCAACHGATGRGDGPAAKGLSEPPADLTAAHLWMHSDGELFWWLSHGIEDPEGGLAMPGFADALSDDERWDLIDYIRARNAGMAFAASGVWPVPVRAPDLQGECLADHTVALGDLHGGFVRLVIGPVAAPSGLPATTFEATTDPAAHPAPGRCIVRDAAVLQAYRIIAGLPEGDLPGTQFLIDGDGWLRAVQRAGATSSWNDPAALSAAIRTLEAHPVAASAPMGHMQM